MLYLHHYLNKSNIPFLYSQEVLQNDKAFMVSLKYNTRQKGQGMTMTKKNNPLDSRNEAFKEGMGTDNINTTVGKQIFFQK